MSLSLKSKSHLIYIVIIGILTLFKFNDLSLPYFWDELGVYSRAVFYQYEHSVSLFPDSVPPELSRGHPLFFTFIVAFAMKVLGTQVLHIHMFCFGISLLLLFVIYIKVSKYFTPLAGSVSVMILAIQPLFIAQSGFVLPEVTLALFFFWALFSFYENKLVLFALLGSCAVLVKEPAIVLPIAVILHAFIIWRVTKVKPLALELKGFCLTMLPCLVFATFFIVQKKQNGWYFFPYHMNLVSFSLIGIWKQMLIYLYIIFTAQGRFMMLLVWCIFILRYLIRKDIKVGDKKASFFLLVAIASFGFICFNSLFTVYMDRYMLTVVVFLSVLTGIVLASLIDSMKIIAIAACALMVIVSLMYLDHCKFNYDADESYRKNVKSLNRSIEFLAQKVKEGGKVNGNFPACFALDFPQAGYAEGLKIQTDITDKDSVYYLIRCDPGSEFVNDDNKIKLTELTKYDDAYAHIIVYMAKRVNFKSNQVH